MTLCRRDENGAKGTSATLPRDSDVLEPCD